MSQLMAIILHSPRHTGQTIDQLIDPTVWSSLKSLKLIGIQTKIFAHSSMENWWKTKREECNSGHFSIFWRINRTNGMLVEQKKHSINGRTKAAQSPTHFQVVRMDILPNARAWFCSWNGFGIRHRPKNYEILQDLCCLSIVVRQAFYHLLLPWHEQSLLVSLVSSRFKCNNKRIIEHSFELNSMNKKYNRIDLMEMTRNQSTLFIRYRCDLWQKSRTLALALLLCFVLFFHFAWFSVKYTVYLVFLRVSFLRIEQSLVTIHNRRIEWIWMII